MRFLMASLTQQRAKIERAKLGWRLALGPAIVCIVWGIGDIVFMRFDLFSSLQLGGGAFLFALALFGLQRARTAETLFDAEHGQGAGVKEPFLRIRED